MAGVYARRRPRTPRVHVRVGPQGRSLRIDRTFASWYKPGVSITGAVWDALAAPLLLLPQTRRRSVLILGLGGGSAARVVRALAPRAQIVGIEIDPQVVRAARRWFDLDELGLQLIQGDARRYLQRTRRRFDLVIEDVFVGAGRSVHKPDWMLDSGLALAARRVGAGGLVVSNALDESAEVARCLGQSFRSVLRIGLAEYDNQIFVGGPRGLTGRALRQAVTAHPLLSVAGLTFRRVSGRRRGIAVRGG